jgi:hypothetical protein
MQPWAVKAASQAAKIGSGHPNHGFLFPNDESRRLCGKLLRFSLFKAATRVGS